MNHDQDLALTMTVDDCNVPDGVQAAFMTSVEEFNATEGPQIEPTHLIQQSIQAPWEDFVGLDPYFDYTTFARPWNYHLDHAVGSSDWFSSQFFAALRETEPAYSPPFQEWSANVDIMSVLGNDHTFQPRGGGAQQSLHGSNPKLSELQAGVAPSRRASRTSSPPNESSHEDRLPFAWDPKSKRIARAKPIKLPPEDPMFANLDPSVSISQDNLSSIGQFLRPTRPTSEEDTFTLPELPLVNVFISFFFNKFASQAPVLHRPTLDVESLPSSLLAIMMAIGSCYSRLRHTRRFGIIIFDRVRQNLLASIEDDNSLMRDPMTIYATALVCYMGLWCGNKRAFELSEALRGVVVTYIRRLPSSHETSNVSITNPYAFIGPTASTAAFPSPQSQWTHWATQESQKRLRWFVYMIDTQFPAILGMSGMLTLAELRKWECPCDEDFWTVPTAKAWKNRLGSASEPSCPIFGSLTALILSTPHSPSGDLLPKLNTWSAALLLTIIMSEIFHFQERLVVLRAYQEHPPSSTDILVPDSDASRLLAMLSIWHRTYNEHQGGHPTASSANIVRISTVVYCLARLYLVFPVSEIQDSLGKSGPADAEAAVDRLRTWTIRCPDQAATALEDALKCISIILAHDGESGPYDLIGLFLCHVVVWALAHAMPPSQKDKMVRQLQINKAILPSVMEVVEAGFVQDDRTENSSQASQLIFRHAVQALVQLGTWGASSNLALLLHLHPSNFL